MDKRILFVDFDRTLFDTPRFIDDFWSAMGDVYGIDTEKAIADVLSYYKYVGDLAFYNFYEHLQALVPSEKPEVVAEKVKAALKANYLYPDVPEFLSTQATRQMRILSFGEMPFQSYKLSLCPELAKLPRDIILEPKRDFLAREYGQAGGWLIDDKPDQKLPAGFTEITLNRQSNEPISKKDDTIIVVNSLKVVGEIL